jgi:putative ABC transport system ATP-binding protein
LTQAEQTSLEARGLSRRFRSRDGDVTALHDISFRATSGQCVGLVGRSGSGKTTLLTLIGLLDKADAGELTVLGKCARSARLDELSAWRRGRVGYLFQDAGLINRSRVLDCVTLPLRYAGIAHQAREDRAHHALDQVGLGDKSRRRVGELSGGERQRVGLARALALDPPMLVCDEPTAPLDEDTSRSVASTLRSFADRGRCVVVATHDPILRDILDFEVRLEKGRQCS